MSATIVPFSPEYLDEVKEIFFESSSKKSFKDETEKEAFFEKYLGYYLRHYPELCLVAVGQRVLGYVVASPVSEGAELEELQPHLGTFKTHFKKYPAHLHINCHHESRGLGIGSGLINEIEKRLMDLEIRGLHIMTGHDATNQKFYKNLSNLGGYYGFIINKHRMLCLAHEPMCLVRERRICIYYALLLQIS